MRSCRTSEDPRSERMRSREEAALGWGVSEFALPLPSWLMTWRPSSEPRVGNSAARSAPRLGLRTSRDPAMPAVHTAEGRSYTAVHYHRQAACSLCSLQAAEHWCVTSCKRASFLTSATSFCVTVWHVQFGCNLSKIAQNNLRFTLLCHLSNHS